MPDVHNEDFVMAGYGTDQGFQDWAAENGYVLPDGAVSATLRQKGAVYVDGTYGSQFPGVRAGGYDQDRAWPRKGAVLASGETVPADKVPTAIIHASYEAAVQEALSPGSLSAIGSGVDRIKREKVGPLETEYQDAGDVTDAAALIPIITTIEGMIAPFLMRPLPAIMVV